MIELALGFGVVVGYLAAALWYARKLHAEQVSHQHVTEALHLEMHRLRIELLSMSRTPHDVLEELKSRGADS